jgi:hypothetical protein
MKNLLPLATILLLSALPLSATGFSADLAPGVSYPAAIGLGQDPQSHSVELYPNPITDGRLTISSPDDILSVQVLNITGKIVFSQEYQPNTNSVDIQLEKLEKGLYLVRIGFPNKEMRTEKIMVK